MNRVVEDSPIGKRYWTTKEVSVMLNISVPMVYHWWKKIRGEYKPQKHGRVSAEEVDKVRELAQKEG